MSSQPRNKRRPQRGAFIDANLLVLLVVGSVDRGLIAKHRRLKNFTVDDYDLLLDLLTRVDRVYVTPNTLTETSNLIAYHGEPQRTVLMDKLRVTIHGSEEVVVASTDASSNSKFHQLGLTDAALLEVITAETPLITVDLDLYLAALEKGQDAAVNFTHLRDF